MSSQPSITKLTNCRLALPGGLVQRDLYVSPTTGLILDPQTAFFSAGQQPSAVHDLGGRIVSAGFIEAQLNGGWGFDFSVPSPAYASSLAHLNRELVKTGVTSYTPTVTSQQARVYPAVVPHLAASAVSGRDARAGAQSLGAHLEGPFINPARNGIHNKAVLQRPTGLAALQAVYGADNMQLDPATGRAKVAYVTLAPELDDSETVVRELRARGIVVSVGHSAATYEQALRAVDQGASMVTHLYNAMNQPHHRDVGIVGVLGEAEGGKAFKRPFFGLIADGIHVHPNMVRVAYGAHPEGCILVTDAMMLLGCPDGEYEWTNGEQIIKEGARLTLKGTDGKIAGSSATLVECIENLINWAEIPVVKALETVTSTPAKMLGVQESKGTLKVGADADLVVLSEGVDKNGKVKLSVDEVWKFGVKVHEDRQAQEAARARL